MKKLLFKLGTLTFLFSTLFIWTGCSKDPDPDPELKVSPTSIKLAAIGGESEDVSITSNTNWTIDVDEDWVDVSPMYGNGDETIEVSAEDNPDDTKTNGYNYC